MSALSRVLKMIRRVTLAETRTDHIADELAEVVASLGTNESRLADCMVTAKAEIRAMLAELARGIAEPRQKLEHIIQEVKDVLAD